MQLPEWFDSGQDEALFLRTVLDHVSDCLVVVDTNGRIVLINKPYCQLLEVREEDVIGRHITEVASRRSHYQWRTIDR
jgi:PAS domain S-box-containing protein